MTLIIDESHNAKGFTPGSEVPGRSIEEFYIHHWGAYGQTHDGVVDFFENGPGQTSAHFVVSAGRVSCLVSPADVAWHAGTWDENVRSIGIECHPEATDEDYAQVAELIRWLREQDGQQPLKPHRANYNTTCPGIWDLARLDALANGVQAPAITPATPADITPKPVAQPGEGQCRVDPGDTLSGIAVQFNVSLADLIAVNGITEPDLIYPGMILDLPAGAHEGAPTPAPAPAGLPPYCIVDPNDTLSGIAQQYGVSLQYLLDHNPDIEPDFIVPGQRINLL